ncbi:hypothetical protein [Paenirhodobacter sp. CAU 1674]|uniref:hypothetical protein n=1 Tax=Paenirhodobacter sp. CAU 1674 TaxID=3032596 RepID=UPI0023D9E848|nr:hypothetical protein [Paenirhodobacter sp. CAU 1674]MDF2142822.1 hypothetical protein [Paenirhodobacter sp. CAU 1674]
MEGFYAVYYTGVSGFGHAVLVIEDGVVTGADATGGVYDGTFSIGAEGTISIEVTLTVPAGTTLVTGQTLPSPCSQTIKAELPANFAGGQPVPMQTPLGPVNAIFKKLRGM